MKNCFFMIMVFLMVCCTDQQMANDYHKEKVALTAEQEYQALVEKARWGDKQAFIQLADCYRIGIGVKKDFVGMLCMVAQAEEYNSFGYFDVYMKNLPDDSDFKLVYEAIELYDHKQMEKAKAKTERLIAMGSPEGYAIDGLITMDSGDTIGAVQLLRMAASEGSSFAELLLCIPNSKNANKSDIEKLKQLADRIPFAYLYLAHLYAGRNSEVLRDDELASYYYLKADEKAFLSMRGAAWLLEHHKNGNSIHLSDRDVLRLKILAGEMDDDENHIESVDTLTAE